MSRLEKYVCATYICLAIVLGGIAGYYKFVISDEANDSGKNSEKILSSGSTIKKYGQVVNVDSNLCIREEPNLNSPADNYLYNGMTFSILEKNNSWYKIQYNDVVGYVKDNYIEEYEKTPPNPTYDEIHNKKSIIENIIKTPIPIKVELTAYCNCAICSEAWGAETAMQTHTRIGIVAAPKDIPLGSKLFIPELKYYKEDGIFDVEDRGGAVVIKNNGIHIVDVWLPDHEQVKEFERKETIVYMMK
ncbi:SH3 domain-containing protein [Clostridium chromiireducens]|uniref:SH3 domain-containing protein n=1 Tax=Clostridium chromiireducens TaxID=225345 RepID=A0A964W517_9CLOT|nr:SH3 domain-containing protein [Clostridium chromiireducens]MVX66892.1 SH3 domain-containing protein [Clostridium chromiireducens]